MICEVIGFSNQCQEVLGSATETQGSASVKCMEMNE